MMVQINDIPPTLDTLLSWVLLEHIPNADLYLLTSIVLLTALIFIQIHAFSRPPPVPSKRLPPRPTLQILFKPDDVTTTATTTTSTISSSYPSSRHLDSSHDGVGGGGGGGSYDTRQQQQPPSVVPAMRRSVQSSSASDVPVPPTKLPSVGLAPSPEEGDFPFGSRTTTDAEEDDILSGVDESTTPSADPDAAAPVTEEESATFLHTNDLPDSFAPLLSSSETSVLLHQLTVDLLHAIHVEGEARIRKGRHEIPLDKDPSRPQLVLDVGTKSGCRITAIANVGSDKFSSTEDLDVHKPTTSRSKPMVKHAGLVLDPPLPLANVAPTLIHFPTLFEDNVVPSLRRIQIVRFAIDFVISISSFLERLLWILESKCQIHLSKVRVTPLYKGKSEKDGRPQWRLDLAFSGHVLLFGWIPVPFISVTLPTFIIPQPHALLEHLLTPQPLASARLKRENIAEERILLSLLDTVDTWNVKCKAVATPPALGVDLTLPGGLVLGMEMMHGRDVNPVGGSSVRRLDGGNVGDATTSSSSPYPPSTIGLTERSPSGTSLSSWGTYPDRPTNSTTGGRVMGGSLPKYFDANTLVPWSVDIAVKGSVDPQRLTVNVTKLSLRHDDPTQIQTKRSQLSIAGSVVICRADPLSLSDHSGSILRKRSNSHGHTQLVTGSNSPSVCSMLLFPPKHTSASKRLSEVLQYDYAFDIGQDTRLDAVSLSVGATHPMLKGGTIITTVLESIYAHGSLTAREGATMDPSEKRRKRNILRHLPAVDFTAGIQNAYLLNGSFSDDGQTKCLPELNGGRLMIRAMGGILDPTLSEDDIDTTINTTAHSTSINTSITTVGTGTSSVGSSEYSNNMLVSDGIKLVVDFGIGSFALNSETNVTEFPELDIFEDSKLFSLLSGSFNGRVSSHLRPQPLSPESTTPTTSPGGGGGGVSSTGPNIFNPLEAYEIDFTDSSISLKIKECVATLGHRRVIIPTETTFVIQVVDSIVDMSLEGSTECELSWDFQGSSPILQVTTVGQSPARATHENKHQASLLIPPLRQGRITLEVSPVGGIAIGEAATSREDKEGLYDWKFFNAIVSPDEESPERIMQVLHDKRTMNKLLQISKLVNGDLEKVLRYILTQVWRGKEIFDQEGVSDPGKAIPSFKMARLLSLFLCGDASEANEIVPIIRRVVAGDGLDVVKVKELLRNHLEAYDDWAPELDRGIRWAAVLLGPMAAPQPYVETDVPPLAELPRYASRFVGIPSAKELYDQLAEKRSLPLDQSFSNLVSRVAPYMSFRQIEYVLRARQSADWQPSDLRRLRYVYSVKKKVLEISESYGGLSFLPQSFLVSVFLGEATRASLRAWDGGRKRPHQRPKEALNWPQQQRMSKISTLSTLRKRRMMAPQVNPKQRTSVQMNPGHSIPENISDEDLNIIVLSPAGRVASQNNFAAYYAARAKMQISPDFKSDIDSVDTSHSPKEHRREEYELGDSLLGPQDVAILLQAGLTSSMKGSTVVQLNQRMLLDLIASQPKSFAVAVLAEIGTPGGQGSLRGLTSALIALLDLDQSSFTEVHRLDMHALLESWLSGFKIPRREDYLAGGRWARQSYYEAVMGVAKNILEDAECYIALKGHVQRVRHHREVDPIPLAKELDPRGSNVGIDIDDGAQMNDTPSIKLTNSVEAAKDKIQVADAHAKVVVAEILENEKAARESETYKYATSLYWEAFDACAAVLKTDKLAFQSDWFKTFYRRNYDALMVKSVYDNVIDNVDRVREWLDALRRGARRAEKSTQEEPNDGDFFANPEAIGEQELIDAIIDVIFYEPSERETIRKDPLVRLLISNPPGHYNFTIVSAMGVITEGKKGTELSTALSRLKEIRGVHTIRADTGTARSFEYNAAKIEEAIELAMKLNRPFGLLGYSQGCANALMAESLLFSGSPVQQHGLASSRAGLVCRQLLFSAANGSIHGPSMDIKVQRLIVMCEEFFKYQQGYFSRALTTTVLELLNNILDSAAFQKFNGGAQTFFQEGSKAFWREAQHLPHVPTTCLRGVLEDHTTPEALDWLSNMLAKESGSSLHDSQVHVYDAVGYPVYTKNRNGRILENCYMGGAIQRTHHWSPLCEEVEFVKTKRDIDQATFECAKDRHVFPWVDVNVRFGVIKYDSAADAKDK